MSVMNDLPAAAPLAMPDQNLRSSFHDPLAPSTAVAWRIRRRQWAVLAATLLLTAAFVSEMTAILAANGLTGMEIVMIVLFAATFVWLAMTLVNAVIGAVIRIRMRGRSPGAWPPGAPLTIALLAPTYNEAPDRVVANATAMLSALSAARSRHRFDVFVLSDTRDDAIADAERRAIERARMTLPKGAHVYYRRRDANIDKKSGNIREWCERFGARYEAMVVLDADSLMSAHAIERLADELAADPGAALVQSVPRLINTPTLFGRLQRFATAAYGPVLAEGMCFWTGDDGNYWGHNAIIRTRAFAACAGLPRLRHRGAFGGSILSHDFVEAALLRRAGWRVRIVPSLKESYEESPPALIDVILRDQRWSQGNLQHIGLIGATGFRLMSRFHLLQGIMSYVLAPIWCLFLLAGIAVWIQNEASGVYLTTNWFLYDPFLPSEDPERAFSLLLLTLFVLAAPKLIGLISTLWIERGARQWGGALGLTGAVAIEFVLSSMVAPIMMIHQTKSILRMIFGISAGWKPQQREARRVSLWTLLRFHWLEALIGLAAGAFIVAGVLSIWLLPIAASLALAVPISALLSATTVGFVDRTGILKTPEDVRRPGIVARVARLRPILAPKSEAA